MKTTKTMRTTFLTRELANEFISKLSYQGYILNYSEYSSPSYKVLKVRGGSTYYIYVHYYYYAGTLNVPCNGPLYEG